MVHDLVPTVVGIFVAVAIVVGAKSLAEWCNRRDR
jgi:hypothetical protein